MKLIVNTDFGKYKAGQEITDPKEIAEILAGEGQFYVSKVALKK